MHPHAGPGCQAISKTKMSPEKQYSAAGGLLGFQGARGMQGWFAWGGVGCSFICCSFGGGFWVWGFFVSLGFLFLIYGLRMKSKDDSLKLFVSVPD